MSFAKEEISLATELLTLYSKQGVFLLSEYKKIHELHEKLQEAIKGDEHVLELEFVVFLYNVVKVSSSRHPTDLDNMGPIFKLSSKLKEVAVELQKKAKDEKEVKEEPKILELSS